MTTCERHNNLYQKQPPPHRHPLTKLELILQRANGVFALRSITRRFSPSTHVAEREKPSDARSFMASRTW